MLNTVFQLNEVKYSIRWRVEKRQVSVVTTYVVTWSWYYYRTIILEQNSYDAKLSYTANFSMKLRW